MQGLAARYSADAGLGFIYTELRNQPSDWVTHDVTPTAPHTLTAVTPAPTLILSSACMIDPTDGAYVPIDGSRSFAMKVYVDPTVTDGSERAILVRGSNGSISRLYGVKYSTMNLYEYFTFSPYNYWMSWGSWQADGGKMYSGQTFTFSDHVRILDVTEFMTPKYIKYYRESFIPEGAIWDERFWYMRSPHVDPNPNTTDNYWNHNDGRMRGDDYGLIMEDPMGPGTYIEWDGVSIDDIIMPDDLPSEYQSGYYQARINDIPIANRITGADWLWNKWYKPTDYYGYPAEWVSTEQLHTQRQPTEFAALISGSPLDGIVKEEATGGTFIDVIAISEETYENDAKSHGMYITREKPDGVVVYIDGYDPEHRHVMEGGVIEINGYEVLREKTFYNAEDTTEKNTVQLDVYNMRQAGIDATPDNGIVWAEADIVVSRAWQLPEGGMTFLSERSIYLHGSMNFVQWQPAAAMASERIYTLSGGAMGFDFPTELPDTYYYPDYPYLSPNYPGDTVDEKNDNWRARPEYNPVHAVWQNHSYYISLVGYFANTPWVLERWGGSSRTIQGSFVRLEKPDFKWGGWPNEGYPAIDVKMRRCCDGTGHPDHPKFPTGACRDCNSYNGWPWNMTSNGPGGDNNIYKYEPQYAGSIPPGGLAGISESIWLEMADTDYNFTHHYAAISGGPPVE